MINETSTGAVLEMAKEFGGSEPDAGNPRSRLNAIKHGPRVPIAEPVVLPHEDAAELQVRIRQWVDDYQPADAIERELVERAARSSWALDRSERHEAAILAKQIRAAMLQPRSERVREVCDLGRKLFDGAGRRDDGTPAAGESDDPWAFVTRLEEFSEGVRWLLDRWNELRLLFVSGADWGPLDRFRMVRLLGKHPIDAVNDPELNRLFLAWDVLDQDAGERFWRSIKTRMSHDDATLGDALSWRLLTPRPESAEAAMGVVATVINREIERLADHRAALEEIEGDDARALAEEASFCASAAGERLRRHQTAVTRELHRAIELLTKLRARRQQNGATNEAESAFLPRPETPFRVGGARDGRCTPRPPEFTPRDHNPNRDGGGRPAPRPAEFTPRDHNPNRDGDVSGDQPAARSPDTSSRDRGRPALTPQEAAARRRRKNKAGRRS